jgi:hypothetical protein
MLPGFNPLALTAWILEAFIWVSFGIDRWIEAPTILTTFSDSIDHVVKI